MVAGAAGIVGMPGPPAAFDTESYDRIDESGYRSVNR